MKVFAKKTQSLLKCACVPYSAADTCTTCTTFPASYGTFPCSGTYRAGRRCWWPGCFWEPSRRGPWLCTGTALHHPPARSSRSAEGNPASSPHPGQPHRDTHTETDTTVRDCHKKRAGEALEIFQLICARPGGVTICAKWSLLYSPGGTAAKEAS